MTGPAHRQTFPRVNPAFLLYSFLVFLYPLLCQKLCLERFSSLGKLSHKIGMYWFNNKAVRLSVCIRVRMAAIRDQRCDCVFLSSCSVHVYVPCACVCACLCVRACVQTCCVLSLLVLLTYEYFTCYWQLATFSLLFICISWYFFLQESLYFGFVLFLNK